MKILVTGGAGFIGSHVVDAYVGLGHEVSVVDDLSSGKRENVNPGAKFYQTDIRSAELTGIVEKERPDVINHHAAQISVPASVADPLLDADINIKGLLNLLEAARKSKVKKVIFISSGGAIYGEAGEYPTGEGSPVRPLSPYGVSKYCSEKYLGFYKHQYGLEYTALRYANVYGPRQIPHGEAGVVAIFMDNLLAGKPSTLYSFDDEPLGMTRDYCYVGDVASANVAALSSGINEAFNIGTGVPTRTLELFDVIFEAIKKKNPAIDPSLATPGRAMARPGDLKRSCLRVEKAGKKLGWQAETGLACGMEKTLDWRTAR